MEITDSKTAMAWLAAWSGKPRYGIAQAAVSGLRSAAIISRQHRNESAGRRYDEAADIIAQSQEVRS